MPPATTATRPAGLVGHAHRPGQAARHGPLFVVCANLLGGCQGTTGPSSTDPATGRPYGSRFPMLTVRDLVAVHRALVVGHLGIARPLGAIGGSLGGMQVLQWALDHPDELRAAVLVCATARLTAQNIAFSAIAREAITRDPDFHGGDFYEQPRGPELGLSWPAWSATSPTCPSRPWRRSSGAGCRTPMSPAHLRRRLRRRELPAPPGPSRSCAASTRTRTCTTPASWTTSTRSASPTPPRACARSGTRFLLLSFSSDWRFGTPHTRAIAERLEAAAVDHATHEVDSPFGHDSFLFALPEYHRLVSAFLTEVHAGGRGAPTPAT